MRYKRSNPLTASRFTLGIGLLILASTQASAATFLVDDDGVQCPTSTHSTIQAAVNAAAPGDTIEVCAGTYPELVTVNKTLTLEGAQAGVDARSGRTGLPATESVVKGNVNGSTSFFVTASDVTIDGFTVQDQTNANQFGAAIVLGAGTSGADVVNNIVQSNVVGLFLANNPAGSGLLVQFNLFRNNNVPGPANSAIYTDEFVAGGALSKVLIDSNDFLGNTDGIVLSSSTPGSQTDVTMSGNKFDGNGRAFFLFNLEQSKITRNSVTGMTGAATADIRIFGGVVGLSVTCNTLANGAGRAMRINDGVGGNPNSDITINDNNVSGYANVGLEVNTGGYSGGPGSLNAENNWWGSPTGPTIASNPGGTGEEIVDPDGVVDYTPFRTAPVPDADNDGILDPCDEEVLVGPPLDKDDCKNGGWMTFNVPREFKNQGDCIQFVNTGK